MASTSATSVTSHSPPRTNGWECLWHPLQVLSWLFILLMAVSHYGFLVYYFPSHWRLLGYIAPGLILVVIVVSIIVTTSIDPADPHLKQNLLLGIFKRGRFNRSLHEHVIEDLHCHLCNTDVTRKAKHCRICDKCIEGFDHHCKWLNTCIGTKNYRWFVITITSGLIGTTTATLIAMVFFVLFFASRDHVRHYCGNAYNISSCDSSIKLFGVVVNDTVFPVFTGLLTVLNGIALVLVAHLSLFHYYLIFKGISTYDYITMQRAETSNEDSKGILCVKKNVNRISPSEENNIGSVAVGSDMRSLPVQLERTSDENMELNEIPDEAAATTLYTVSHIHNSNNSLDMINNLDEGTLIHPVEYSPSPEPPDTPPLIEEDPLVFDGKGQSPMMSEEYSHSLPNLILPSIK